MNKADVDRWLRAYVEAWKSYDREQISALFGEDAKYRYHPYDDPVEGREAVVHAWLGQGADAGVSNRDQPGTYDAYYHAIAVDRDVAVATGTTTYLASPGGPVEKVFDNCFVLRFDSDDRCVEFTEWYVRRPKPQLMSVESNVMQPADSMAEVFGDSDIAAACIDLAGCAVSALLQLL